MKLAITDVEDEGQIKEVVVGERSPDSLMMTEVELDSAGFFRPHLVCCDSALHTCISTHPIFKSNRSQHNPAIMETLKRKSPDFLSAADATPTGRPVKKMCLTRNQKQALIDNLQLESAWDRQF